MRKVSILQVSGPQFTGAGAEGGGAAADVITFGGFCPSLEFVPWGKETKQPLKNVTHMLGNALNIKS